MDKDTFLVIKMSFIEMLALIVLFIFLMGFVWSIGKGFGREIAYKEVSNVEQPSLEMEVICERILYERGSNARRL